MKELGAYLKESRISHGVSLDEAAEDLQLTSNELENIESGNTRAFQDVYTLKDHVRNYAKYLGLDPDKVLDEFNDFLFEHTSKISLSDILEEENRRKEKEKKKIVSPYTKIKKQKSINKAPIVLISLIMILLLLVIYLLIRNVSNERTIDTELQATVNQEEERNEYTY